MIIGIAETLDRARRDRAACPNGARTIRTPEDRASYFGCVENGSAFGTLAGDAGVGTHGGSEDHAAILTSRAGWLQQFAFAPLRIERAVAMPAGWTFAIACTGIRANKTGDARAAYNQASASAARVAAAWREPHPPNAPARATRARAGALCIRGSARGPARSARALHCRRRAGRDAAAAFERADIGEIGPLADASQQDAERLLGNQVPETTEMVALALESGAAAASGFGAGWGGSVWALIETTLQRPFLDQWLRATALATRT